MISEHIKLKHQGGAKKAKKREKGASWKGIRRYDVGQMFGTQDDANYLKAGKQVVEKKEEGGEETPLMGGHPLLKGSTGGRIDAENKVCPRAKREVFSRPDKS